jgi:hypothetical protein
MPNKQRAMPRNGKLDQALADLARTQAIMQNTQATLEQAMAGLVANQVTFQASFMALQSRIDAQFQDIRAILARHEALLEALPEAVRRRTGFEGRREPAGGEQDAE